MVQVPRFFRVPLAGCTLLVLTGAPVWAQDSTAATPPAATAPPVTAMPLTDDFAGWMAKGREYLAHPGEGENDVRRKWDKSFIKPEQAAKAFLEAAAKAPGAEAKFEALNEAGKSFRSSYKFERAYEAFIKARDLRVAADLRAQAALDAATTYQTVNNGLKKEERKPDLVVQEFNLVQGIPGAPVAIRAEAHRLLGLYLAIEKRYMGAILEYEAAARLDPLKAEANINSAIGNLSHLEPSPEAVAIVDRVYTFSLNLRASKITDPNDAGIGERLARKQWASQLLRLKAAARAVQELTKVANDPRLPATDQYDALKSLAATQREAKDFKGALATYDRTLAIANLAFFRLKETAYSKAEVQANSGDYVGATTTLEKLSSNPQAQPDNKGEFFQQIAKIHNFQAKNLAAANKGANVTKQLSDARQAYAAGLNVPNLSSQAKLSLITDWSIFEAEHGNFVAAHQQVQNGLELFKTGFPLYQQSLYKTDARIYGAAKEYEKAMASLVMASLVKTNAYDREIGTLSMDLYHHALGEKQWDSAKHIVDVLVRTGLSEPDKLLMLAQIETEAGNKEAARAHLAGLAGKYLFGDKKKLYDELKKKTE